VYLLQDLLQNPKRYYEEPWFSVESFFENTGLKDFFCGKWPFYFDGKFWLQRSCF